MALSILAYTWRSSPAPPSGLTVLQSVLEDFESIAVGGIVIFIRGDAPGDHRLHVIHGVRKYPRVFCSYSFLKGKIFGYLNDISPMGDANIIQLTDTIHDA